jgi:hypothetical protein
MLEGFAEYADAVALLLDDENDARRVTRRFSQDGVLRDEHVKLWERSLEEDNFMPRELLELRRPYRVAFEPSIACEVKSPLRVSLLSTRHPR